MSSKSMQNIITVTTPPRLGTSAHRSARRFPSLSDPLHVADAIVRNGHKVTTASMWMFNGQLIADAPPEERLEVIINN